MVCPRHNEVYDSMINDVGRVVLVCWSCVVDNYNPPEKEEKE